MNERRDDLGAPWHCNVYHGSEGLGEFWRAVRVAGEIDGIDADPHLRCSDAGSFGTSQSQEDDIAAWKECRGDTLPYLGCRASAGHISNGLIPLDAHHATVDIVLSTLGRSILKLNAMSLSVIDAKADNVTFCFHGHQKTQGRV